MSASDGPAFIHATALVLGERGLLLRGASGAGKSALALALLARFSQKGDFARLVGDDRVSVEAMNGRLLARPHPAIAGVIEARGLGLLRMPHESVCALHAVIDVHQGEQAPPRLPDEEAQWASLAGIKLPRLATLGCSDASVARIIFFVQRITTI
ncbi:MAG: aldolase [Methylocystis sp.]|nr:MAG: aldolase [Methylocystis sp.]